MTRIYRFMVTVAVEGDKKTLPDVVELAEYLATQVQDEEDHNLSVCVRPIETQDFRQGETSIPLTKGVKA